MRAAAQAAIERGDWARAAVLLHDFAHDRPGWPPAVDWVDEAARLAADAGDVDLALRWLQGFATRVPPGAAPYRLRVRAALLMLDAGRPSEAARLLDALAAPSLPLGARQELELTRSRCDLQMATRETRSAEALRLRSAARERLERAWQAVYQRLRDRPEADQRLVERLAERIGLDLAELDVWFGDLPAALATLSRLARECSGHALALAFVRLAQDLGRTGESVSALEAESLEVRTPGVMAGQQAGLARGPRRLHRLDDGRVTVLQVWAAWCPPARESWVELDRLVRQLRAEKRVRVVALSLDEPGRYPGLEQFLAPRKPTWEQLWDPKAWKGPAARALALPGRGIPFRVLLDGRGRIIRAGLSGAFLQLAVRREIERPGEGAPR